MNKGDDFVECKLPTYRSAFNFLLYLYFTHTLLLQCSRNINVKKTHESQNEKLTKMSLEVYPKTRKRASLCHFAPVSEIAFILKKWVLISQPFHYDWRDKSETFIQKFFFFFLNQLVGEKCRR
jgi:hypothetical protein